MTKKVTFGNPPPKAQAAASADAWVSTGKPLETKETPEAGEPMKRLTIDVPQSLHARIKVQCAANGRQMADEIRSLLETKFPAVKS
jgi:hypothetical protein